MGTNRRTEPLSDSRRTEPLSDSRRTEPLPARKERAPDCKRDEMIALVEGHGSYTKQANGTYLYPCHRCNGVGIRREFSHVASGICFLCDNQKGRFYTLEKAAAKVKRQRTYEANRPAREAKQAAKQAAAIEANIAALDPRIAALLAAHDLIAATALDEEAPNGLDFPADLAKNWIERGDLSEGQWEWVEKLTAEPRERIVEEEKVEEPEAVAIPADLLEGRSEITFRILGFKSVDTNFGSQLKMLIQIESGDGAFKLWGSSPHSLFEIFADENPFLPERYQDWAKEQVWTMHARVSRSDRDRAFGFYSRPTKVKLAQVHSDYIDCNRDESSCIE